jgi:membrane protease YdiL (CAAX protease family)
VISLLAYFPFLAVALIAQWSDRHRVVRWVTYGLILLFDAVVALAGVLMLLIGRSWAVQRLLVSQAPGMGLVSWGVVGLMLVGTALLSSVFLLPFVRRGLSRLIPIDPESGIHATALALAVLMVGLNASRTPRETWERLGLARVTWRQAGLTVGLALVILIAFYGVDWAWRLLAPESYEMMDALGDVLYGGFTWYQSILISLIAAVTEELFFRGALQPRFGFLLTALLFTGVHVQYGLTPATLEVLGAALALGWLRRRTNTSACILLHMLYDIAGLLVFPMLP